MNFNDARQQFKRLITYLRNDREMKVQMFDSRLEVNEYEAKLRLAVTDDCEWADSFKADLDEESLDAAFNRAWSWAMNIPPRNERLMQLLIRRMQGLASVADSGALHDEANRQLWQGFADMMRQRAEEISKNGLPRPEGTQTYATIADQKRADWR